MPLETATAMLRTKAAEAPPLGHRVRIDLGADGTILWDGTGATPAIDNAPGTDDAEAIITISLADFDLLVAGALDPTMAYMSGRLKVAGSMGVALKLGQLLGD